MSQVSVDEVKARLNKSLSVDDGELQDMIDAAEAEYAEVVGPLVSDTVNYDGVQDVFLPKNVTVTGVTHLDGTVIDLDDLFHNTRSGELTWSSYRTSTSTYMLSPWATGRRSLLISFTASLPANHREAIIADVAGYFAATQRGGGASRFPGEGYAEAYEAPGTPLTLFPRIRALAAQLPGIA